MKVGRNMYLKGRFGEVSDRNKENGEKVISAAKNFWLNCVLVT